MTFILGFIAGAAGITAAYIMAGTVRRLRHRGDLRATFLDGYERGKAGQLPPSESSALGSYGSSPATIESALRDEQPPGGQQHSGGGRDAQ